MIIKHRAVILLLALAAASASVATPAGFSDGGDGLVAVLAQPAPDAPLPSSGG